MLNTKRARAAEKKENYIKGSVLKDVGAHMPVKRLRIKNMENKKRLIEAIIVYGLAIGVVVMFIIIFLE